MVRFFETPLYMFNYFMYFIYSIVMFAGNNSITLRFTFEVLLCGARSAFNLRLMVPLSS